MPGRYEWRDIGLFEKHRKIRERSTYKRPGGWEHAGVFMQQWLQRHNHEVLGCAGEGRIF